MVFPENDAMSIFSVSGHIKLQIPNWEEILRMKVSLFLFIYFPHKAIQTAGEE